MSWLKNIGDSIWKATKSVVASPLVQTVASAVGFGGVASAVDSVVNPEQKTVAQVVQATPVVQPVTQVVQAPETASKEVQAVVQQASGKNYMPYMMAGGFGLLAVLMMRK